MKIPANFSIFVFNLSSTMQSCLRQIFLTILLLLSGLIGFCQHFGGNPPSIKWKQYNNDTVRVIFPEGLEEEALRVHNNILFLSRKSRENIGHKTKKLNLVLQNQSVISNGYVGLAPYRSEFYVSPPQDNRESGSMNWLDLLSIHEYRHALQFTNARYGLTQVGNILSGESGWAVMMNLSIPNWYFEGDAVASETAWSKQGRGRLASFFNNSRALLLNDIKYRYDKASNGSLKDRVPNNYELGFMMSTYGRENYDNSFWREVLKEAGSYRRGFYPFSSAIKHRTGMNTKRFYDSTYSYFQKKWSLNDAKKKSLGSILFKNDQNTVTNYSYPRFDGDSTFYFLMSSYKQIPKIYYYNGRKTETVMSPGITTDNYFSIGKNKLAWSALNYDERWGWQQYSDIYTYDLEKGKKNRLTQKQRYFAPSFSNDGKELLVFENTAQQEKSLKILNATTGHVVEKIPNPNNLYYSYPIFAKDEDSILAIAKNEEGQNALVKIDRNSGRHEILSPFSFHIISRFSESSKGIYFVASYSGINNIFFIDSSKSVAKITNSNYGILDISVNKKSNRLLYTEYSLEGNVLKEVLLDTTNAITFEIPAIQDLRIYDYSFQKPSLEKIEDTVDTKARKYPLLSHPINIHSWIPIVDDPFYGITLQSKNILNTLELEAGYEYNRNESSGGIFLNGSYSQYYPVIDFGIAHRNRSSITDLDSSLNWTETKSSIGYSLPFNFSGGLFYRSLLFSNGYNNYHLDYSNKMTEPNNFNTFIQTVDMRARFQMQKIKARQNIFTQFGLHADISYELLYPFSSNDQVYAELDLALPGLSINHNLILESEFQLNDANRYQLQNRFHYIRGFERVPHDGIYKLSANYHFPLFYPDWGFAGINYFYRSRMNLFVDYSESSFYNMKTKYKSIGAELIFDTKFFNALSVSYGFRYSYILSSADYSLVENRKGIFEFFLPVSSF